MPNRHKPTERKKERGTKFSKPKTKTAAVIPEAPREKRPNAQPAEKQWAQGQEESQHLCYVINAEGRKPEMPCHLIKIHAGKALWEHSVAVANDDGMAEH